ncbi:MULTISPECIES: extracellular solute-binding protein [Bacillaceae]|uniref:ABC transporter substrate-binding protein n=1 Tax=Evansella alkalicola TaxID=745819 RepID=A0ABS6JWJ4_9BACI|nr:MULTISPECIES: ABC transporter substrate-binding protein [Bacillaceae]MBU9722966.1 ABC transporter substrate-binding protein [Bacillus alkalicola]
MSKFLKLFAVMILGILLVVACNGDDDAETTGGGDQDGDADDGEEVSTESFGDGEIELVFWEFGNTGYDVLIEEYIADNPHISINLQNSDMDDNHDNLFTSISAGSGAPDIAMVEVGAIERFRAAGDSFHNLLDFGAGDVEGNFLDWVWRTAQSADQSTVLGLPTDIGPTVMFYRTDVIEEAGYDSSPEAVSELMSTWDDFAAFAQELHDKTGKQIADNFDLIYNAKRDQLTEQYFNTDGELVLEGNSGLKEAYDYTVDLLEAGLIGDYGLWSGEWFAGMGDGSYATMLAPAWMQGVIKDNEPEEGVWSITTMPEGAGNWGGSFLTIPSETEHAEEAYAFIEWLTAPEQQLKAFLGYGLFPSAPAVYDMPEFIEYEDDYFGGIPTAVIFSEAAEAVVPVYKGRYFQPVDDEIKEAFEDVAAGTDPEEAWEGAFDRIQRIVDR